MPTEVRPPTLEVRNLQKHFPARGNWFGRRASVMRAVDGVSFAIRRGQTLGLVGESGCGKTTTGRMLVRLEDPTDGELLLDGQDFARARGGELRGYRRRVQMVFQDAMASLDPRMTVGESIAEPLLVQGGELARGRRARVGHLLHQVGLGSSIAERLPHQLSGGQRQRVGIARALALAPDVIVADEPTSALDVSVRAQVINLLRDLQVQLQLSFLFISHDLSTVRYTSDEVAVMYLGRIVEQGPTEALFADPRHPYTQALLAAVPTPDPDLEASRQMVAPLGGELPGATAAATMGCSFSSRCPFVTDRCRVEAPPLRESGAGRQVACHLA
ncbi:MAG TPA: oligopeptide/dipeptide ABC transporter ATP-binding protein [Chloroflexota bacterium]